MGSGSGLGLGLEQSTYGPSASIVPKASRSRGVHPADLGTCFAVTFQISASRCATWASQGYGLRVGARGRGSGWGLGLVVRVRG